jgi:hypothetical protein
MVVNILTPVNQMELQRRCRLKRRISVYSALLLNRLIYPSVRVSFLAGVKLFGYAMKFNVSCVCDVTCLYLVTLVK